jgi:glycosyltransferase involved in cell wall biosynthesis
MSNTIELSVIVPVGERYDDVRSLYHDYKRGIDASGLRYELIYVLDGDRPEVFKELVELQQQGEKLKLIKLAKSFGEAIALTVGFDNASGESLLTLPAYYQVDPTEIPKLISELQNCDMVISHRWPRTGSGFEVFRRRVFHGTLKLFTGVSYRDLGCGVRALKRQVAQEVTLYGDQHRFLPVLASRRGFKVKELDVAQSPKDYFRGAYRPREYLHRLLDIFTIFFLVRFTKKPLRFFGMIGSLTAVAGGIVVLYLVIQRLFLGMPLAERPALLLSSLLVVLGVQILGLGLIGELIIFTHARELKEYNVEKIIN